MSKIFQLTSHLKYVPKDTIDLISEFDQLFSSFKSQIKKFILTQPTFLQEIRNQIKSEIGFLSPQQKNMALALYGIIITEDILKEYSPSQYVNDISFLLEATEKKNKCTDDEFIGIVTTYINCLKVAQTSTNAVINSFIELKGVGIDDEIITGILIRRYYYYIFTEINEMFEIAEFPIDIRWITALLAYSLETAVQKTKQQDDSKSISGIYRKILNKYPPCDGSKYIFDLIYEFVIKEYYDILDRTFKQRAELKKIERGLLKKEDSSKEVKEASKEEAKRKTEHLITVIEKAISETLKFNRDFDERKRKNLEANIETSLKRLAFDEFGVQDIADEEKYMTYLLESWFKLFLEWPQMVIPIINLTAYSRFLNDPVNYIKKHKDEIERQLQFKIRRQIGGERMTPKNLSEAFSKLLYEILNNSSVRTLTI
ncbi:MAG: hypothetical protein K9W45_04620 [Candidatus Heimdallarchaeum aukensis]|uniref:Uncharacterized protein n=1 Tax=Candidatus Heimdallarchaeum aukensis TaxID=2876573 RepID=A0A9Y1BMW6_9ARCH|nr:MAG: hypothetical protein K9W45_04620 [Candidatus Heimdallarchaeum aukensis]